MHRLPNLYKEASDTEKKQLDISFPKIEKFDYLPQSSSDSVTAFVSVAEGCNKYCSFCVVPHTRGHEVSRPVEDILVEIEGLASRGVREVNLLGQNVNNFKGSFEGEKKSLAFLIEKVSKVNGIDRIRYTTSHPFEFKDDLVDLYKDTPELVSHVHLPVQSGSDRILKLMRRRYSAASYLELISRIRENRPGISFSSDFIVGFPGETDKDFQDTLDIVEKVGFDESFSFIYSPRPNTPAAEMEDNVSDSIKKERLQELQSKLYYFSNGYSRKMVGTSQRILVMGVSKKDPGQLYGRTVCNKVVNFTSQNVDLIGQLINIQIVEALPNSLKGNLK